MLFMTIREAGVYSEKENASNPHFKFDIVLLAFVILFVTAFLAFAPPQSPDAPLILLIGVVGAALFAGLCEIIRLLRHIARRFPPDDKADA